jgi:hypothetical protein
MDTAGKSNLKDERRLRKGRVVDAAGNPVAGALVAVVWGTVATPDIGRRTNQEGAFQVGLPPGQFRIRAFTEQAAGEVEVEGGEGEEIVISLLEENR